LLDRGLIKSWQRSGFNLNCNLNIEVLELSFGWRRNSASGP
jgi:hypothetical protein